MRMLKMSFNIPYVPISLDQWRGFARRAPHRAGAVVCGVALDASLPPPTLIPALVDPSMTCIPIPRI